MVGVQREIVDTGVNVVVGAVGAGQWSHIAVFCVLGYRWSLCNLLCNVVLQTFGGMSCPVEKLADNTYFLDPYTLVNLRHVCMNNHISEEKFSDHSGVSKMLSCLSDSWAKHLFSLMSLCW